MFDTFRAGRLMLISIDTIFPIWFGGAATMIIRFVTHSSLYELYVRCMESFHWADSPPIHTAMLSEYERYGSACKATVAWLCCLWSRNVKACMVADYHYSTKRRRPSPMRFNPSRYHRRLLHLFCLALSCWNLPPAVPTLRHYVAVGGRRDEPLRCPLGLSPCLQVRATSEPQD